MKGLTPKAFSHFLVLLANCHDQLTYKAPRLVVDSRLLKTPSSAAILGRWLTVSLFSSYMRFLC